MTASEILVLYKATEGYSGTDFDTVISSKIDIVREYMLNSGCNQKQLLSRVGAECIMRGVSDIWRQDKPQFSELFTNLLIQVMAIK